MLAARLAIVIVIVNVIVIPEEVDVFLAARQSCDSSAGS